MKCLIRAHQKIERNEKEIESKMSGANGCEHMDGKKDDEEKSRTHAVRKELRKIDG